jgi:predicted RNase H-like HicB family nuclease
MKTFILKVTLIKEIDSRWSAIIPDLPGCSSWGYSQQEALENIKDAAEVYIEDMIETGQGVPSPSERIEIFDEPAIAVSL